MFFIFATAQGEKRCILVNSVNNHYITLHIEIHLNAVVKNGILYRLLFLTQYYSQDIIIISQPGSNELIFT